jgi:DNA invertase Pin-like site-specific DNA recombinase
LFRKGCLSRVDCLARSICDLQTIVAAIKAKGAALTCTDQPLDTGTAAGKCFLDMLGVFAESRRTSAKSAISTASPAQKPTALTRTGSIIAAEVRRLSQDGVAATEIAKRLGASVATVYRILTANRAAA